LVAAMTVLYVPAGQSEQTVEPGMVLNAPAGQSWQLPAPAALILPAGHKAHEVDAAGANEPAKQTTQVDELLAPMVALEVPAAQATHAAAEFAPAVGPYVPAGQDRHAVPLVAAMVVLYVPAEQSEQTVDPGMVLNEPAGQSWHVAAPAALNLPAGHRPHALDPAGANLPAEQVTHDDELAAPTTALAVPAGHGVQPVAPICAANVPAAQGVHGAEPVALNVPGAQTCPVAGLEKHSTSAALPTSNKVRTMFTWEPPVWR
jgi:hypothetical protein